jgi:hypothetical protein
MTGRVCFMSWALFAHGMAGKHWVGVEARVLFVCIVGRRIGYYVEMRHWTPGGLLEQSKLQNTIDASEANGGFHNNGAFKDCKRYKRQSSWTKATVDHIHSERQELTAFSAELLKRCEGENAIALKLYLWNTMEVFC